MRSAGSNHNAGDRARGDETEGASIAPAAQTVTLRRLASPLRDFLATENASAVVLLAATVTALVWANSPWSGGYEGLWSTHVEIGVGGSRLSLELREWVNDGLMALFFFVVGLEIRREFDLGEPAARGWGIPMGTDTAFALGALTLVGGVFVDRLRPFLLTLVIVDDIIALLVIAIVYTDDLSVRALVVAVLLFGVVLLMRRAGVRNGVAALTRAARARRRVVAPLPRGAHARVRAHGEAEPRSRDLAERAPPVPV